MEQKETPSKISISNNQMALMLTFWALFTQVRDTISAWAVAKEHQSIINKQVETMTTDITSFKTLLTDHTQQLSKMNGDIKAEVNRSYEADQGFQRLLDQISRKTEQPKKE